MRPANTLLAELLRPVEEDMDRARAIVREQLSDPSPSVRDMTDHVGRLHGKQLRGALLLLAGEATGNTTDEHPAVAAIVEMIHLATLVHDDILDGAEVRRRVACVNQRWDNQVAVLLGDFLYARAFALSTALSSRLCSRMLAETTRQLCVGEIEQNGARYDFEMSQERYESICGAKTAALYAAGCELGARYPGGNEEMGGRMRSFGWELGLAFQLVDDCLDLVGSQDVVGKTIGTDVEEGKVTLPVLHAYAHAGDALRARIRDIYTLPDLHDRARVLREECDLSPGLDFTMRRARELAVSARERVTSLPPSPARASMEGVIEFTLSRDW